MVKTLAFVLICSICAAIDVSAQQRRDIRFAQMDTNNDGVISQQEWRGSARSFQVHDWNRDGMLSGDEVRRGAVRRGQAEPEPFDYSEREYGYNDWTPRGFTALDHNSDGRVSREEWHFDLETFRRADHNRDGWLSRAEFLGEGDADDDRGDRFAWLDANNDGRVARAEWHGTAERFDALDDNRDGVLTRAEMRGTSDPPADLFTSVDVNRDNSISRNEWHWSPASFNSRDRNSDGRLSREEFSGTAPAAPSEVWKRGHERGMIEGRQAGKEDRAATWGWDLEGQRELENADSGYEQRFGSRAEYQAGNRERFRKGYREGFGPR
jgi:Ca2+-binding EF-hand superfamily protein